MSLRWTIDDTHRTVDVIAEGEVTLADAMAFFDDMERAKALPYNKLLDGAHGYAVMTDEELMAVAARVRSLHSLDVMGALAIVITREQSHRLARVLGAAAVADRPIKVFDDVRQARRWRDAQVPRGL
jgi:hypothetical protein